MDQQIHHIQGSSQFVYQRAKEYIYRVHSINVRWK